MDSFTVWMLKGLHAKQEKSRLSKISNIIDWTSIRPILDEMYDNKSEKGGRPNCDVIMMFKILIFQKWYGLSDLEVERQMADLYHLWLFLVFLIPSQIPEPYGYSNNAWQRLGKDKMVWAELQRQLDAMGLKVKRGTIQTQHSSTQIPVLQRSPVVMMLRPVAVVMEHGLKKGDETHFGYKLHQKTDMDYSLIREIETSTASLHDSQVDLSFKDEIVRKIKDILAQQR